PISSLIGRSGYSAQAGVDMATVVPNANAKIAFIFVSSQKCFTGLARLEPALRPATTVMLLANHGPQNIGLQQRTKSFLREHVTVLQTPPPARYPWQRPRIRH